MKSISIFKFVFYFFIFIFILSLGVNIWKMTLIENNHFINDFLKAEISTSILDALLAILLGLFGVKLLSIFSENEVDFYKISKYFKYLGYTFITGVLINSVVQISIQSIDMPGIYLRIINDSILISLLGVFLISVSMIIKKADYYKSQNDLTI